MSQETRPTTRPEIQPTAHRFTVAFNEQNPSIPIDHNVLGNKGLKVIEMTRMGLSVPEGFVVTTDAWRQFAANKNTIPDSVWGEIINQLIILESKTGTFFGDPGSPLFISVRSGAAVSMPGAMETILNVGITDTTLPALASQIGDSAAISSYTGLITSIGIYAYHIPPEKFTRLEQENQDANNLLIQTKNLFRQEAGQDFPQDPLNQLLDAVGAVFDSWNSNLAQEQRRQNNISDALGTAATVQRMVWGNSQKEGAGSGVILTRDPHIFSDQPTVEFAPHSQGLAVVGEGNDYQQESFDELPDQMQVKILEIANLLESHFFRPQDIEFTHDGNRLWLLQTRDAPISPLSWFRFLEHSVNNNQLTREAAERLISTGQLYALLIPDLDPDAKAVAERLGRGIAISLGNATGRVVTSLEEIRQNLSEPVVLTAKLRQEDLIRLPKNVVGISAVNGSIGSHIARIAGHIGFTENMPIVFGVNYLRTLRAGEQVTIDGLTGEILAGNIKRLENGSMITDSERKIIEALLKKKLENPWESVSDGGTIKDLETLVKNALDQARVDFTSPKAQEIAVLRRIIDPKISIEYTPFKPDNTRAMRDLLTEILEEGNDATVRTCHYPLRPASSPWVLLTKPEDIERFFRDPVYSQKYGGYPRWLTEPDFKEAIIGRIPKGKLNPDPAIQHEHCAWTLACTDTGVVLQINPYSSQLRSHEETSGESIITVETSYDPKEQKLEPYAIRLGEKLEGDRDAAAFAFLVADTIFNKWWNAHQIPERLAAIARVFPQPDYAIPVLEGQARIRPDGTSWCKIYGLKTDKQEND